MRKLHKYITAALALLPLLSVASVSAHAVVKPSQVEPASRQEFTISVPNEKDSPTIRVRLVVPENVSSVSPNVKPGWNITLQKTDDGDIAGITWSDGMIPPELRDTFVFSAKMPAENGKIGWKIYQTYQDGSEVAWDRDSISEEEGEDSGPMSTTEVLATDDQSDASNNSPNPALIIACLALGVSLLSLLVKRS